MYLRMGSEHKEYFILVKALDELYEKYRKRFELHVYVPVLIKDYILENRIPLEREKYSPEAKK